MAAARDPQGASSYGVASVSLRSWRGWGGNGVQTALTSYTIAERVMLMSRPPSTLSSRVWSVVDEQSQSVCSGCCFAAAINLELGQNGGYMGTGRFRGDI